MSRPPPGWADHVRVACRSPKGPRSSRRPVPYMNVSRPWRIFAVVALAACTSPTVPETNHGRFFSVVTNELVPVEDSYVEENRPHRNRGDDARLRVKGKDSTSRVHRALVRFDSTAIEAAIGTDSLVSATLDLHVTESSGWGSGSARFVGVHRLTEAWTEGGATWACANDTDVSNSTLDCGAGDQWSMEGAGVPFAAVSDSVLVDNSAAGSVLSFDVTSDVRAFLSGSVQNLGWIVLKSDETANGDIDLSSRTGSVAPVLRLTSDSQNSTPAVPPNIQPPELDAGLVSSTDGDLVSTTVLSVYFQVGATDAEVQSALGLVGGTVIGGVNTGGFGWYYVQVAGDGTTNMTFQLARTLDALPQVRLASPYVRFAVEANHVSPDDGAAWSSGDWTPVKASAMGDNYNFEAINAPLAWGCTVGDANTVVGVLDIGFGTASSDEGNLTVARGLNFGTGTHGQYVASIIGAEGNNQIGMTGMMWRGQVVGYDASQVNAAGQVVTNPTTGGPVMRDIDVLAQLQAASAAGAHVVNISLGKRWGTTPSTPNDSTLARTYAAPLGHWLRLGITLGQGPRPLYVVSAGNDATTQGQDAFWNGFPIVEAEFPMHVLVVGASDVTNTLWVESKQGANMVVAPGVDVRGLGVSGLTPTLDTGTSFSAPLVAGIAGLLKSFDSTLDTPTIMDLIRQGAAAGGTMVGGFPLVDAYESLRLAAQKSGTPLCGNRMWVDGTQVTVQRGAGVELITPTVAAASLNMIRFHGGQRLDVEYYDNGLREARTFEYTTSGWTSSAAQPLPTALEESRSGFGTFFSSASHDVDFQVLAFDDRSVPDVELARTPTTTFSPMSVQTFSGFLGASPAYSPLEDRGFIGIRSTDATGAVDIHSVDLISGVATVIGQVTAPVPVAPFFSPNVSLAVSEDGQEVIVQKDRQDGTCELDFMGASDGVVRFTTIVTPDVGGTNPTCGDLRGGFSAAPARVMADDSNGPGSGFRLQSN